MAKNNNPGMETAEPEATQVDAVSDDTVVNADGEAVVTDTVEVPVEDVVEAPVEEAEVAVVKTKKELKKEKKELKKHKKEVKKEAKRHSAKRTKAQNFWLGVLMIAVIIVMLACVFLLFKSYKNIMGGATAAPGDVQTTSSQQSTPAANPGSSSSSNSNASSDTPAATPDDAAPAGDDGAVAAPGDLSTPAGVVAYYKTAHANALSKAKSVTKTYDNTINYNDVLEIGGNSTLEKVAKSLMSSFMKEDTEAHEFSGGDIAANFPPAGGNSDGLTEDMVSTATCTEEGGNYIIKIAINSTEEAPDLGEKTKNLVTTVDEKQVTDAAGSVVTLSGLENRYVGANIIATVDKASGNLTAIETYVPSYMFFGQAKVAIIKVDNCRIGLEYQQKWTVNY